MLVNASNERPSFYRGRFAPSPSGPLHFGSLITALASFIHAKQHHGRWLVRIEDIDPPREQVGAASLILKTLEAFGLHWDETVLYQSQQSDRYNSVLADLASQGLTYHCQCTRAQIKQMGGIYQGHCQSLNLAVQPLASDHSAIRLINQYGIEHFQDLIQGQVQCDSALAKEDFILKRKDGLFAYQLAVVLDDIEQNINHIIRGCDLLEPTARQLTFFQTLKQPTPTFGHIPLAVTEQGYKLSKQNKAPALDIKNPQPALIAALAFLGQKTPTDLAQASVDEIMTWAKITFNFNQVPKQAEIML